MNLKLKVNELLPNPYRNLEHYKLDEGKITELINSYKVSGYWPIIIVRKNKDGNYETAYGEHRKEAYRRLYGKNAEIEVIVLKLSDEAMLRMMANENSDTWTSGFINDVETVQSVVKAFAVGQVALPAPKMGSSAKTAPDLRFAPSFVKVNQTRDRAFDDKAYSIQTIADFLGWVKPSGEPKEKVYQSIFALSFIEQGVLGIEELVGLNSEKAQALLRETRFTTKRVAVQKAVLKERLDHVQKEAKQTSNPDLRDRMEKEKALIEEKVERINRLPKQVAKQVSATLKKGTSAKIARDTTDHVLSQDVPRPLPSDREFINKLADDISEFLDPYYDKVRGEKLKAVVENQENIDAASVRGLLRAFEHHIKVCNTWVTKLEKGQGNNNERSAVKSLPVK